MTASHKPQGRGIHPLGAYVAKRCPVRLQWDVANPTEPLPEIASGLRADRGNDFEEQLTALSFDGPPKAGWVRIDRSGDDRDQIAGLTLAAMNDGAKVIFDGRLPIDVKGHRVGEPDMLVRYGNKKVDGTWRYFPVDIKHHATLGDEASEHDGALVSSLDQPFFHKKKSDKEHRPRVNHKGDALQLVHYARILDCHQHMAPKWFGAIVGKEQQLVWYDLNKEMFRTRSTSDPAKATKMRSALECYDHEFNFRVDVMKAAANSSGPTDPSLLTVPLRSSECSTCIWRDYCIPLLEEGSGHVTLVPHVGYKQWLDMKAEDIETRQDLVDSVSFLTARLAADISQERLQALIGAAKQQPGEPIASILRANAKKMHEAFADCGITTTDELVDLFNTLPVLPQKVAKLNAVIEAKAALDPEPYIPRPFRSVEAPPRFDIEVDVDMENTIDDHVYLWGALVTDTKTGESKYHPFVDWNAQSPEAEQAVFNSFWDWFSQLKKDTEKAGRTFGAYCWHAAAENRRLRELADESRIDEVEAFIESDSWVDLLLTFRDSYATGSGYGLKKIAVLADFDWRAEDAGGERSMDYFDAQLHPETSKEEAAEARRWLLEYNEDDVLATKAIRIWQDNI